jgi:acetylornithine deacetylase/succinyl-diaminopimelate desuccinylase-like protein
MHKRTVERLVQLAANAPRGLPRGLRDTVWAFVLLCQIAVPVAPAVAETLTPYQQLARDIFKELVEINTVSTTGDTGRAADAMAARLRAAGFGAQEVQVFKYAPGKGNLVARLRGTGQRKPILLVAHLDVVPAKPEDWSYDPFKLTEKDGYYYGRGTSDDKYMAATFVTNLIRYKKEGFRPNRDIVVALTADEEIGSRGIQWLVKNKRDLINAEFSLNEGANVAFRNGKPFRINISTAEKTTVNFHLEVKDRGGHSATPRPDNPIYHLAEGLARLAKFSFPLHFNATTRAFFERMAELESPRMANDLRSILSSQPDEVALARVSANDGYNAALRTTCVATELSGGHANNALPQTARATINCRVVPGESAAYVRETLIRVLADDRIGIDEPREREPVEPTPMDKELLSAIEKTAGEFWPEVPVVQTMTPGSSDSRILRLAGIPSYGHSGGPGSDRSHGKDERVPVKGFFEGGEYLYRLVKRLSGAS